MDYLVSKVLQDSHGSLAWCDDVRDGKRADTSDTF